MLNVEDGGPVRRETRGLVRRSVRPPRGTDLATLSALVALAGLGLLNLHGLQLHSLQVHQFATLLIGVVLFLVVRRLPPTALTRFGWGCYALSVVLLAIVIVLGSDSYGARRWLSFGSTTLQPSEFAKAGLVLVLAQVLAAPRGWPWRLTVALCLAAVPIMLVALEPDLSTATVLAITTLAMLVLGRIPLRALASLVGAVVILAPIGEHLLKPYQAERLHAFLSGSRGAGGSGWTILQAHIALAWGGISGQAGKALDPVIADYLPARETDLAYASLIEQWGMRAGALAVPAAAVLVWRGAVNSRSAATTGAALSAAGFAMLIATEVSVSVAANLGLLPTAGVPFPLLSYGGTAAAVHVAMAGLIIGQRSQAQTHRLWLPPHGGAHARASCGSPRAPSPPGGRDARLRLARAARPRGRWCGRLDPDDTLLVVPAPRGEITDRHGVALARNRHLDDVWAVPRLMSAGAARRTRSAHGSQRRGDQAPDRGLDPWAVRAGGDTALGAGSPSRGGRTARRSGRPGTATGVSGGDAARFGARVGGHRHAPGLARWPGLSLGHHGRPGRPRADLRSGPARCRRPAVRVRRTRRARAGRHAHRGSPDAGGERPAHARSRPAARVHPGARPRPADRRRHRRRRRDGSA